MGKTRLDKPTTLPDNSESEPDIAIVELLGREYLEHHLKQPLMLK